MDWTDPSGPESAGPSSDVFVYPAWVYLCSERIMGRDAGVSVVTFCRLIGRCQSVFKSAAVSFRRTADEI